MRENFWQNGPELNEKKLMRINFSKVLQCVKLEEENFFLINLFGLLESIYIYIYILFFIILVVFQ